MRPEHDLPAVTTVLGLVHPVGSVATIRVHGSGAARALASSRGDGPADLVLLAPTKAEARDHDWVDHAARAAAAAGAQDGIVVAAPASRGLTRALARSGLVPTTRLLHVPDVARSRFTFPVGGATAAFALGSLVPLAPVKRAAVRAAARSLPALLPSTSVVYRRAHVRPLFAWLAELAEPQRVTGAIVAQSWRRGGAAVVFRFIGGSTPDVVVKLGEGAGDEARALDRLGADAAAAGASVPTVLGDVTIAGVTGVAETFVAGAPAAVAVRGSARLTHRLIERLGSWLERWNATTAVTRPFDPELVLQPAARLAPYLPEAYVASLRRDALRLAGIPIPHVAAHNDLTAANVLVGSSPTIGVVDWHLAAPGCLPLRDLAYAAADAAAAVDGYADRPRAFAAAFTRDGAFQAVTSRLIDEARRALDLDPRTAALCLHSCWLSHADHEVASTSQTNPAGPFLSILRQWAETPVGA